MGRAEGGGRGDKKRQGEEEEEEWLLKKEEGGGGNRHRVNVSKGSGCGGVDVGKNSAEICSIKLQTMEHLAKVLPQTFFRTTFRISHSQQDITDTNSFLINDLR